MTKSDTKTMELSKNLKRICRERQISLTLLAKKSGVKQPTLHGWSTGRSVKNLDDLRRVCDILEIGLYSLLFGRPDPHEKSDMIFKELFKGDVKITIHRMEQKDD